MDNYIAHANIDHYLELLGQDDISPAKRSMVTTLLIEEANKLSHDLEQLQFVENKLAASRNRVDQLKRLRGGFAEGSADHMRVDSQVRRSESILAEIEIFCGRMRRRIQSRGL